MGKSKRVLSRRKFIGTTLKAAMLSATVFGGFPAIVPSGVFGRNAPSNKINIGQIGAGHIAMTFDLPEILKSDEARVVAVADPDKKRAAAGKALIENHYSKKTGNTGNPDVRIYEDYHSIIQDPGIDAVIISTPVHWHVQPAIEAALAGKDVYLQTPASLTISEGRLLCEVVKRQKSILQTAGRQGLSSQFRIAAELVRNGRIGKPVTVKIGLKELGQHYFETAAWATRTELTGPSSAEAVALFPETDFWDIHGDFMARAEYKNGITMLAGRGYKNGIRYEGTEGWIFVPGDDSPYSSEGITGIPGIPEASDPEILSDLTGSKMTVLYEADDRHSNWLECIRSRREPSSPAEKGHRACSVGLILHIAMKLGRKLTWDPDKEEFLRDNEANSMLSSTRRYRYGAEYIKI